MTRAEQQKDIDRCAQFHGLSAGERDQIVAAVQSDRSASVKKIKQEIRLESRKHPVCVGFDGNRHTISQGEKNNEDWDFFISQALNRQRKKILADQEYDDDRSALLQKQRGQLAALIESGKIKPTVLNFLMRFAAGKLNEKDVRRWLPRLEQLRAEGVFE